MIHGYPPLLCTKQIASYLLSTSERGVHELCVRGELTRIRDGGKWVKIPLSSVYAYLERLGGGVPPATTPELLTRTDVAFLLSMSARRVGELISTRALPSVDISARGAIATRVRLADLRAYVAALPEWDAVADHNSPRGKRGSTSL